jgi:hypothetical protein
LIVLFGGGAASRRRAIGEDGVAPINSPLFLVSKCRILVIWGAMVLRNWCIGFAVDLPEVLAGRALDL